MKRILGPATLVLVGLVIGFAGGWYLGSRFARGEKSLLTAGRVAWAGSYAASQYLEADYDTAKQALQDFIRVLETVDSEETLLSEKMLTVDLGLSHGRLALLEERAGNPEAAAEAMTAAVEYLRQADWKDPSEGKLREFLAGVDRIEQEPDESP